MALLVDISFCLRNALMRAIAWKKIDVRASMTAGLSEFAVVIRYEPFNVLSDRASRNMWAHCAGDPCATVRWTIGDTDSMKSRICFGKVRAGDSKTTQPRLPMPKHWQYPLHRAGLSLTISAGAYHCRMLQICGLRLSRKNLVLILRIPGTAILNISVSVSERGRSASIDWNIIDFRLAASISCPTNAFGYNIGDILQCHLMDVVEECTGKGVISHGM